MSAANALQALWLAWFSKPVADRLLYRLVRQGRPRKIMMLGLGDLTRALKLLSLAERYHSAEQIQFAGIDPFDSRPADVPRLALKDAHRLLRPSGVKVNLVPGKLFEALARSANALREMELVVISSELDDAALAPAWFYMPRMLAAQAIVLREEQRAEGAVFKHLASAQLQQLSAKATPRRRAA